ncbi:MAG: HNH endonuclease [Phycisphaerales bacterium]
MTAVVTALDSKVLVLNRLYMAIRVVSARRAFRLLVKNLAEVIDVADGQYLNYDFESWADLTRLREEMAVDGYEWVRTVRFDIPVPKIIRLLGYDRLPRQHVKLNRRNIFARDRNQCQYCGRSFPTSELSIDHVTPRSQGGGDSWENLVCACTRCNARKGGRTPDQANLTLVRPPVEPRRNPLISARLGHEKYACWQAFLDNAYWSVELK